MAYKAEVEARLEKWGVHRNTVHRWLVKYSLAKHVS